MTHAIATTPLDEKRHADAAPGFQAPRELEDQVEELLGEVAGATERVSAEAAGAASVDTDELRESVNQALAGSGDDAARAVVQLDRALSGTAEKFLDDEFAERAEVITEARGVADPAREDPAQVMARTEEESCVEASAVESPAAGAAEAGPSEHSLGTDTMKVPRKAAAMSALQMAGNVLALPMRGLPPAARDLVGWFSLVTLFNAACVWLYVLVR